MPEREFIHSLRDVKTIITFALDCGMIVLLDKPQACPQPHVIEQKEITEIDRGVFLLLLPSWKYGPYQMTTISGGVNKGFYSISPGVNHSPITLYFQGERNDGEKRRLGSGILSFKHDWLELPLKRVRSTPTDVEVWFEKIALHLFSKRTIRAGGHRYHLCKGVVADSHDSQYIPPFDFIPWS